MAGKIARYTGDTGNVLARGHSDTLTGRSDLALMLQYQRKYEVTERQPMGNEGSGEGSGETAPRDSDELLGRPDLFNGKRTLEAAKHSYEMAYPWYRTVLGPSHPCPTKYYGPFCVHAQDAFGSTSRCVKKSLGNRKVGTICPSKLICRSQTQA